MEDEDLGQQPIKNRYAATHPVIFEMQVRGTDWPTFSRTIEDDIIAKVIGSSPEDGLINVTLAVLDQDTGEMIENAFGA